MNILVDLAKKLDIIPAPQVDTVSCVMRARAILEANRLGVFQALEALAADLHAFADLGHAHQVAIVDIALGKGGLDGLKIQLVSALAQIGGQPGGKFGAE